MSKNMTICNHCCGDIILSLNDYIEKGLLKFCSKTCAEAFFSKDNPEPYPSGLADELGLEEYGC